MSIILGEEVLKIPQYEGGSLEDAYVIGPFDF
jgi:hypothetical protein